MDGLCASLVASLGIVPRRCVQGIPRSKLEQGRLGLEMSRTKKGKDVSRKEIINVDVVEAGDIPLSRVVGYGDLLFVSGMVSIDVDAGKPEFASIEEETTRVLNNLSLLLQRSGSSLEYVLKTTVFLAQRDFFESMNKIYEKFFQDNPPARSTVVVTLAADYKIEIEAIAYRTQ